MRAVLTLCSVVGLRLTNLMEERQLNYQEYAERARAALILAAMRRSIVTYKELAVSIDLPTGLPLPHHINRVLRLVSEACSRRAEPSLAVLVVNATTGEPGAGFEEGVRTWFGEAQQCFRQWRSPA